MELHLKSPNGREVLRLARSGESIALTLEDGTPVEARVSEVAAHCLLVNLDGRSYRVHFWRNGGVLHLQMDGRSLQLELEDPDEAAAAGASDQSPVLRAPMPGKILEVLAEVGAAVEPGQPLVRMEAMKMEIDVTAPVAGTVGSVHVRPGQLVDPDAELVRIDADDATAGD